MSARTYEQPCPDCGGYLTELGDGARCIDCDSMHQPCWKGDCLGFLETNGWNGTQAILSCGQCGTDAKMFDKFSPALVPTGGAD